MNYLKLRKLKNRFYFNVEDLSELWKVKLESARVLCTRNTKKGIFVRLKRNFYVLNDNWENLTQKNLLQLSNFLQVPSPSACSATSCSLAGLS